jgi:hypothetical protein
MVTTLSPTRGAGAILALKLARLVLGVSTALHQRRAMPRPLLRAALSATGALERVGALFVRGRRSAARQPLSNQDDCKDHLG